MSDWKDRCTSRDTRLEETKQKSRAFNVVRRIIAVARDTTSDNNKRRRKTR